MTNAFDPDSLDALPDKLRGLIDRRERLLGPAYKLFYDEPVHVVRAQGVWLYGPDGERYLDVYNNVPSVGHCHPKVISAVEAQIATLNSHTRYLNDVILNYAEALSSHFPEPYQFMFTCTGSEASDLAIRIARAHTGGTGIIVTENAYHGITASVAAFSPSLGKGEPLGADVRTVPAPRPGGGDASRLLSNSIRAAAADLERHGVKPAALIVDTLFSSDGVYPDPAGFLSAAAEAIREVGGLFIADEVQPGFGRTGVFFGFERHAVIPDLVVMGKPMGNGMPIAGVAAKPPFLASFAKRARYFNTFAGNPVSCAAAQAVLDVIDEEDLMANARRVGAAILDGLASLENKRGIIRNARGAGLFLAADIRANEEPHQQDRGLAERIVNGLRQRGVLISTTGRYGDILKIRPPLPFSLSDADLFLGRLDEVLSSL